MKNIPFAPFSTLYCLIRTSFSDIYISQNSRVSSTDDMNIVPVCFDDKEPNPIMFNEFNDVKEGIKLTFEI